MGVYIPDMKMPSSCLMCDIPVRVQPCPVDHDDVSNYKSSRHPACPLIPVPPNGRLGDLDKLINRIEESIDAAKKAGNHEWWYACTVALDFALAAPTVIDAEEGE